MNHRQGRAILFCIAAALTLLCSSAAQAGSLDATAGPDNASSAMYSLQDLQNRLATGAAGAKRSGGFTEPGAGPGATGASLNDIMALMPAADNANGAKTIDVPADKTFWGLNAASGQWGLQTGTSHVASYVCASHWSGTNCDACATGWSGTNCDACATGWAGANCDACATGWGGTSCRFRDNNNGTVTDTRTGLVWLKNANPCDVKSWVGAGTYCANLASGTAGLTDGSTAGQWRLPTVQELEGIGTDPPTTYCLDGRCSSPSVTWTMPGSPFTNVQSDYYWSSTSYAYYTGVAWFVDMYYGVVYNGSKAHSYYYVWPVRAGQ